eukprot:310126_1
MSLEDWSASNVICFTVDLLLSSVGLFITVYSMYHIFYGSKKIMQQVDTKLIWITITCFLCWTITNIFENIAFYYDFINYQETTGLVLFYIWYILFLAGKCFLYLTYIYRLYITFKPTAYAYSKMRVIMAVAVIWTLHTFNVLMVLIYGAFYTANTVSMAFEISILITDIVLTSCALYFFVHPIVVLIRTIKEMEMKSKMDVLQYTSDQEDAPSKSPKSPSEPAEPSQPSKSPKSPKIGKKKDKYSNLLKISAKITILTLLSLSTTIIWQLLWVISLSVEHGNNHLYSVAFLYAFDLTANTFCLYLSNNFANDQYRKICEFLKIEGGCMKIIECCAYY